jgi:dTDP-4-dehydrorhamnose reductase
MKILVFGAKGMVGSRVAELLGNDFDFVCPSERDVDISDPESLKKFLSKERPQVVINFAAITDVDYCETERENKNGLVWKVNAEAPRQISILSCEQEFFFVQISTDMVFPGTKQNPGPYSEAHKIGDYSELTWYGASKAEGEVEVLAENRKNAIVRIIYPVRHEFPKKLDYARKILKLFDEGKMYPMFDDQIVSITYIDELADAIRTIASQKLSGVFHVSSVNTTTPYEFATYLLKKTRSTKNLVKKASFEKFIKGKDARRYPQFGGLNAEATQKRLGIKFSTWQEIVDKLTVNIS